MARSRATISNENCFVWNFLYKFHPSVVPPLKLPENRERSGKNVTFALAHSVSSTSWCVLSCEYPHVN